MQKLVNDLMLELRELDTRIAAFDREFAELSRTDKTMRSLSPLAMGPHLRKRVTSRHGRGSFPVK